jgi:hypothetical protein
MAGGWLGFVTNWEEMGRSSTNPLWRSFVWEVSIENEDEKERKARGEATERRQPGPMVNEFVDELFRGDHVPDEIVSLCDWKKPIMELADIVRNNGWLDWLINNSPQRVTYIWASWLN